MDVVIFFHANCIYKMLLSRWSTLKISFAFMTCPVCKKDIEETRCLTIDDELLVLKKLRSHIGKLAIKVSKNQGMERDERL